MTYLSRLSAARRSGSWRWRMIFYPARSDEFPAQPPPASTYFGRENCLEKRCHFCIVYHSY